VCVLFLLPSSGTIENTHTIVVTVMECEFSRVAIGIDVGMKNFCIVRVRVTGRESKIRRKSIERTLTSHELLDYAIVDISKHSGKETHELLVDILTSFVTDNAFVYIEQQKPCWRHIVFALKCICYMHKISNVRVIGSRAKYKTIPNFDVAKSNYRERKRAAVVFLKSFITVNHEKQDDIADAVLVAIEGVNTEK
jgi:Poxvirus A22 protein